MTASARPGVQMRKCITVLHEFSIAYRFVRKYACGLRKEAAYLYVHFVSSHNLQGARKHLETKTTTEIKGPSTK